MDDETLTSIEPINFIWNASSDIDGEILTYTLKMYGTNVDATLENGIDTSLTFEGVNGDFNLLPNNTYSWTVLVSDGFTQMSSIDTFRFVTPEVVNVEDYLNQLPKEYSLGQNYPNPFNPFSSIHFGLPKNSHVTLYVYDLLGQKISKLVDEQMEAGTHRVEFNGSNLSSGVYLYRIQAGVFVDMKKMVLIK